MNDLSLKRILLGSTLMVGLAGTAFAPAYAQNADGAVVPETMEQDADGVFEQIGIDDAEDEFIEEVIDGDNEIVVTGSRLKKDTFSSISPLQVIDTDFAASQGLLNPVDILQSSTASAGQQIDTTFGGFVLDNGPGSETANLRGLGAERTLVLIDGRRVGPSGVEGAPSVPSINNIPITFVDNFEILLDGASSVYGSDAVAGVINAQLKRDFDGLEVDARTSLPEQSGGEDYTVGASYGINGERGFVGVQAEYFFRDNFTTGDRDFLNGCDTYVEQTEDGEIRTGNQFNNYVAGLVGQSAPINDCLPTRLTQRFIAGGFGSIYSQPSIGNTGIDGFSESTLFGVPLDFNGDGVRDVNFDQFSPNGQDQELRDVRGQQEQIAFRGTGEYTFEGSANVTAFADVMYTDRDFESTSTQPQLFPVVPANNPFNPCNIDSPNGQDCNAAYNAVLTDPAYLSAFRTYYNTAAASGTSNCFGLGDTPACDPRTFGLLRPTGTSLTAQPVVGVLGDRTSVATENRQLRTLIGLTGDIPGLSFGPAGDFSWEASAVYSRADSDAIRTGIRSDRLDLALGIDPITGATLDRPCQGAAGLPADVAAGCVPVNLFAPSLYSVAAGSDFATQAERDYLFDDRDFATVYEQTVLEAFVQGRLFTLPGGDVQALVGATWREDDIQSTPDDVARDGLFFGFFSDGGAAGDKVTKELFGEVSIPLGTGQAGFREFTVDLSGRLTDDEFYGTNETYSVKAGWRPIDALLLRGTYGTTFRAPNLRELFLADQTGFLTLFDPCAAPEASIGGGQAPDDTRSDNLLAQCRADGIDPLTFSVGNPFFSTEVATGGVVTTGIDLEPETSDAFTVGASFDQPFTDAFDLEVGFTYYEYDISNSIAQLGAAFIIASCYDDDAGVDPLCALINRDGDGEFDLINQTFFNFDQETAKGVDLNVDLGVSDVNVFGRNVDFFGVADINRQHERLVGLSIEDDDGNFVTIDEELVGEFGFAKWRGRLTGGATVDKFGFTWAAQYIGGVEVDEEDLDVVGFSNFVDSDGDIVTAGGESQGDVDARRVSFADDKWYHTASLRYTANEDLAIQVGVDNVFDSKPPTVDAREVGAISNVPRGSGYDLFGRSFFARISSRF